MLTSLRNSRVVQSARQSRAESSEDTASLHIPLIELDRSMISV